MSKRLRVQIIVSFAGIGGAQIASLRLARGLRDAGHDPDVLCLYEQSPTEAPDHPYRVLSRHPRPGAAGYLGIAWALWRLFRRERPEKVLTFMPLAHIVGQTAALLAGTHMRIVSHRTPVNTISPVMRVLDTVAAWLGIYTGVVAVSEGVRASCRHYPAWLRSRTVVVHNGLRDWRPSTLTREEARERLSVADETLLLVAAGRLAEQKNYPLMLRVAERLDNAVILIAGEGPLYGELETAIAKAGIGRKVRLLGGVSREGIPDLLAAADLFVQTSLYEGQSNAVLEALESGLPVVAHDIPEQRETIADPDGSTAGALVPLGDVDAWVAAIERLRSDAAAFQSARRVVRRRAQLFCYDMMIAGFERALTEGSGSMRAQTGSPRELRAQRDAPLLQTDDTD